MSNPITVTKTMAEILEFQRLAYMRLEREREIKTVSVLSTHLQEMLGEYLVMGGFTGNLTPILEKYRKDLKKLQRSLCTKDEKNNLMFDKHGRMCYTEENMEKMEDAIEEMHKEKFDITTSYCSGLELPLDLMFAEREVYPGFVIKP